MSYKVEEYLREDGTSPYEEWFMGLDTVAAAKITQSSDPCSAELASQNSLSNTRELGVRQSTDTRKGSVLGTRASLSSHPPRRTKAWHHEADWVAHFPQDILHTAPGDRC